MLPRPFGLLFLAVTLPLTLGVGPGPASAQSPQTAATSSSAIDAAAALAPQPLHVLPAKESAPPTELGSIDQGQPYKLKVGLEQAAIWYLHLADYLYAAMADPSKPANHYLIQRKLPGATPGAWYRPFALTALIVNGQRVDLAGAAWTLVSSRSDTQGIAVEAEYALVLADAQDRPVLEVRRTFSLAPDSYELLCRQQIINRLPQPLEVVWEQYAQAEAPLESAAAKGSVFDPRATWLGYFDLKHDPGSSVIFVDDNTRISDKSLLEGKPLPWPPRNLESSEARLAWLATLNRYFALVVHRPFTLAADAPVNAKSVDPLSRLFPVAATQLAGAASPSDTLHVLVTLRSAPVALAPGASAPLDLSLFAGPRSPQLFSAPVYRALFFEDLIHYSLGGCCSFLTFQWLARFLLAFMTLIHAVTFDWALAIIFLVIAVRLVLHPLTRRSQVQMTKFGKQMANLKPEMDALKRKFEKDPRRLQVEQARLMREKGVSPGALLGCLPMFLQMPIWIALYAMLYYAIELRHQPAFWGLFQKITSGAWPFLADLSSPDHFWVFADHPIHVNFPLLSVVDFSALNILPLIWGVLMFIQQKYMAPPAANEQAAQQQKVMMWSMLLFPFMLYSSPSGLTLYILASTAAGILDSYVVKKHIKREEQAGTLFTAKPRKPGFFGRMLENIQDSQRQHQDRDRRLQGDDDSSRYRQR